MFSIKTTAADSNTFSLLPLSQLKDLELASLQQTTQVQQNDLMKMTQVIELLEMEKRQLLANHQQNCKSLEAQMEAQRKVRAHQVILLQSL